jgi:hypothetical protein
LADSFESLCLISYLSKCIEVYESSKWLVTHIKEKSASWRVSSYETRLTSHSVLINLMICHLSCNSQVNAVLALTFHCHTINFHSVISSFGLLFSQYRIKLLFVFPFCQSILDVLEFSDYEITNYYYYF